MSDMVGFMREPCRDFNHFHLSPRKLGRGGKLISHPFPLSINKVTVLVIYDHKPGHIAL